MRPVFRLAIICSTLILILILIGCSTTLRSPQPRDPAVEELSHRYGEHFPEDPYLPNIMQQRIDRGMSPSQVYLAWGRPEHRFKGENDQKWIYEFDEDDDSCPRVLVHLFFENDKLVRWKRDRGFIYFMEPGSHGVSSDDFEELTALNPPKGRSQ